MNAIKGGYIYRGGSSKNGTGVFKLDKNYLIDYINKFNKKLHNESNNSLEKVMFY